MDHRMVDDYIRLENYEMLKALYDFKATFAKTLSFRENDHFILHQSNTKQRNWWQVVNNAGQLGYIPSNYVITVKVAPQFMIDFLEECIEKLRSEFVKPGAPLPIDKQNLVQKLVEKKRQAEQTHRKAKKKAPSPPTFNTTSPNKDYNLLSQNNKKSEDDLKKSTDNKPSSGAKIIDNESENAQIKNTQLPDDQRRLAHSHLSSLPIIENSESTTNNDEFIARNEKTLNQQHNVYQTNRTSPKKNNSTTVTYEIDSRAAYKLIDDVRKSTQLSYEMSKLAVNIVVAGLQHLLPTDMSHYFDAVLNRLEMPLINSKIRIEDTHDANRLKIIFNELASCKDDSQQRSWMLYEDEAIIVEYIKELTSILTNADVNVSKYVLKQDQYNGIITLIQYYQMETRWTIRQLLLQSFGVMCSLDIAVITIMLNSILPMELARDMRANPRNVPKLNYSSLLLTMIFSMGELMPITHLEQLGFDFMIFLLESIEDPPDTDLEDQIPDLFINLILSYNLQFSAMSHIDNNVIDALKERTIAKTFTQKILLLLNREEDPVRIFDHQPAPLHSVLKLFIDLFSTEVTASLFYTNDVKVLIDIILRQLFDIPPGDRRQLYLELCRRVLRTSGYDDHRHRSEDLLKCFTRIFCEEGPESHGDQQLIREISNEFPNFFKM